MNLLSKVNYYIIKLFSFYLLIILSIISSVIGIIDFVERIRVAIAKQETVYFALYLVLLKLPYNLNYTFLFVAFLTFLILIAMLNNNFELIIIQVATYSKFRFLILMMLIASFLYCFKLMVFDPFASYTRVLYDNVNNGIDYKKNQAVNFAESPFWLREESKSEDYIRFINIQAADIRNMELQDVKIFEFDSKMVEFKRVIEAKTANFVGQILSLNDATIYQKNRLSEFEKQLFILSNIHADFLKYKIIYSDIDDNLVKIINIWNIDKLIIELDAYGIDNHKLVISKHNMLSEIFLYMTIALIAYMIMITPPRRAKKFLSYIKAFMIFIPIYIIGQITIYFAYTNLVNYQLIWFTKILIFLIFLFFALRHNR